MRIFFALEIPDTTQVAIARWRDLVLPGLGRAVPPANFHITLDFLGDMTPTVLDRFVNAADGITPPCFDLTLVNVGYFAKAGVYWTAPSSTPRALNELVRSIRKVSRKAGLKTDTRPYQPHLTLYRKCASRPPLPAEPASFEIHCRGFTLFESITGAKGVRYDAIQRW